MVRQTSRGIDFEIVRDWLAKYRETLSEISVQSERLKRLVSSMENAQSPKLTDMPRAPGNASDKMSNYVASKEMIEAGIARQLEFVQKTREAVEDIISDFSPADRSIIRLYDLDGMEWPDVIGILYRDTKPWQKHYSSVTKKRREAVDAMSKAIAEHRKDSWPTLVEISGIIYPNPLG